MNVHWTASAIQQLRAIHDYIAQNSPDYAQRMVDRLTRRSEQIALFPMSGRTVPEYEAPQVREVIEGPYRIIYHIKPNQIDVVAVIHGAQQIISEENTS
jgi:toxin ParE1/3/4